LICDSGADIVALQEARPDFVRQLATHQPLRALYPHISDLTGSTIESYGVVVLSKLSPVNLRFVDLESRMGRKFLMAEFNLNNEKVAVGTVHLESLGTGPVRRSQLKTINKTLEKNFRHRIVVGDFNFDSEINWGNAPGPIENGVLKETMPEAIDTWEYLNEENKSSGKTYDSDINAMIGKYERMRYDRVMLHSQPKDNARSTWVPVRATLIGTEPISKGVWPSDHFGVYVEFVYNN